MRFAVIGVGHWHARRYVAGFRKAGGTLAGVYDAEPGVAAALGARARGALLRRC